MARRRSRPRWCSAAPGSSQARAAVQQEFRGADRRARLQGAFGEIDRLFADTVTTAHIPGGPLRLLPRAHFKTKCFPQTESPERAGCGEWRGILTDRELLNRG